MLTADASIWGVRVPACIMSLGACHDVGQLRLLYGRPGCGVWAIWWTDRAQGVAAKVIPCVLESFSIGSLVHRVRRRAVRRVSWLCVCGTSKILRHVMSLTAEVVSHIEGDLRRYAYGK